MVRRKLAATGSDELPRSASLPSSAAGSPLARGLTLLRRTPTPTCGSTEQNLGQIGRITPLGVVTEFSSGITAGAQPQGITGGPDGNLWFAEVSGNQIGRITTGVIASGYAYISNVNEDTVSNDQPRY